MLKSYLHTHDAKHDHKLQSCVAKKLLSLGSHLPEWLVQSFKVISEGKIYTCDHEHAAQMILIWRLKQYCW